jgi:hypothetical protein
MVRIKVACKDTSKIPKKRLSDMKNNMHLIQFKVERGQYNGTAEDDEGDETPDEGVDNEMEELDHEPEKLVRGNLKKKRDIVVQSKGQTLLGHL